MSEIEKEKKRKKKNDVQLKVKCQSARREHAGVGRWPSKAKRNDKRERRAGKWPSKAKRNDERWAGRWLSKAKRNDILERLAGKWPSKAKRNDERWAGRWPSKAKANYEWRRKGSRRFPLFFFFFQGTVAMSKLPFQQDTDRQAPDRAWHVGGSLSIWKKPKTGKPAPRRALQPELERSCARIVATHRTRSTRVQSSRGSRSRRVQS